MEVADVMTPNPIAVDPNTPLREVARKLVAHCISGVPVRTPDGRVLGIVSEADILEKERAEPRESSLFGRLLDASSNAPRHLAVDARGAMTAPAVTIGAERPISDAASIMLDRCIDGLPVVEPDGRLVGIVTRKDLVRAFSRDDDEIADEIREELTEHAPNDAIDVVVADGEATLAGRVRDGETAGRLADVARRVPGVVAVRSRLSWSIP